MKRNPHRSRIRFEGFDLDPISGELRQGDDVLRLQPQPCKVLLHLAQRPGEVVSRAELYRTLWGEGTYVDAERGLNFCIKELRRTLGDDARQPRFIETLPRRGYRFIAAVEAIPVAPTLVPVTQDAASAPKTSRGRWIAAPLAALGLVAVVSWLALRTDDPGSATPPPEVSPPSEAYLQGRYLAARGTPEALDESLLAFRQAITQNPDAAKPWVALSEVQLALARNRETDLGEALDEAFEAAQRAVALAPESAPAQVVLSRAALYRDLDWALAESAVERALELAPQLAAAHSHHALLLAGLGRHAEALEAAETARRLAPENPSLQLDLGWYHYLARRFDDAVEACERALALEPGFPPALDCLESAHAAAGRYAEALAVETTFDQDINTGAAVAAEARWLASRQREARALETAHSTSRCAAVPLAVELATVGEIDAAFDSLDDALQGRSSWLPLLAVEPRLDPLRDDPRWETFVAQLGRGGAPP